jgi:mRNA interferase MazF
VERGDVVELTLPKGVGHEQFGRRFGVVVQSTAMLERSVVLIAPTSQSALNATFRPVIRVLGGSTKVLVEQLGAVDVRRLGKTVSRVSIDEMWSIDDAFRRVLDL